MTPELQSDDAPLRERLIESRRELLDALRRDGIQQQWLLMLAGIEAALRALDDEA